MPLTLTHDQNANKEPGEVLSRVTDALRTMRMGETEVRTAPSTLMFRTSRSNVYTRHDR
ncbi:MAG: hypothetical protein OXQ92_06260 [Boseongicola sp.]|nr:hypothetical protein [Boseongicola sp.]MDD9979519.1 hypothetical protein [Boseongicola sp.]